MSKLWMNIQQNGKYTTPDKIVELTNLEDIHFVFFYLEVNKLMIDKT